MTHKQSKTWRNLGSAGLSWCRRDVLLASLVLVVALHAAPPAGKPKKTAADIDWPKPSRPPGTVTVKCERPTEKEWDPLLTKFRESLGAEFAKMIAAAEAFAKAPPAKPAFRVSPSTTPLTPGATDAPEGKTGVPPVDRQGQAGVPPVGQQQNARSGKTPEEQAGRLSSVEAGRLSSPAGFIRAIDIVRIPVLTGGPLDAKLASLRRQLDLLGQDGYPLAVWEIVDLPAPEKLNEWADKCFAVFARPPILMLGWHISNGVILPERQSMTAFLARYAGRCHSIILTGEELNTQYYGRADGGLVLDYFRYWLGVIRQANPETFVWLRIDEMIFEPNDRQLAWTRGLLPLTDGLNYQIAHGGAPLQAGQPVSEQFGRVLKFVRETDGRTAAGPGQAPRVRPVLPGGFVYGIVPDKRQPAGAGIARAAPAIAAYEKWVGREGFTGYIRFVGYLPESPQAMLAGRELSEATGKQ